MIRVVAAVLRDVQGKVLIAQRPPGKIAAGQWEFPGGKIEPDEAPEQALRRELAEELGIEVLGQRRLIRLVHHYSDRSVDLDTWEVSAWRGVPRGLENQALAWVTPQALSDWPLLEADAPIVTAIQLPSQLVINPPGITTTGLSAGFEALAGSGRLLRLRLPELDDATYLQAVRHAQALGLRVITDRAAGLADGAWGLHLRARDLDRTSAPARRAGQRLSASCHNAGELARAQALGADFLVLGPVARTPTHPDLAPMGWERFAELVAACSVPVFAIGGLGPQDVGQARAAGGQGVAGIRSFWPGSGD